MKLYTAMPDQDQLARDVLGTTLRPCQGIRPAVLSSGAQVVLNVVGVLPRIDAGAVYLEPASRRHRLATPRPARLIVVTAVIREGRDIEWCEGVVGEIEEQPSS